MNTRALESFSSSDQFQNQNEVKKQTNMHQGIDNKVAMKC